jgi:hypothetical protein
MKWTKETRWNIVSDCKRYRITKAKAHTPWQLSHGEWVYAAFRDGKVLAAGSLDDCKAACRG